ncbi:MAG: MBL fold metallo-hydrolase [Armatimonadota bacterium]|nr:MBL fold metallo-hydrolase [bacterium]
MRSYHLILLVPLLLGAIQPCICAPRFKSTFTLWQLPEQTHSQMMSYVMRTGKGKVIVIDGGTRGDAAYLKAFLKKLGGEVEAWFLTHPHFDHYEALADTLSNPDGIKVKRLYASMPQEEWVRQYEPEWAYGIAEINAAVKKSGKCFNEMQLGEVLDFDGVRVEVLGVKNPEIHTNAVNNSSVVLRVQDSQKSVLFLADLGLEGGEKLLKSKFAKRLHTDYVQMAHHGQSGVSERVYQLIQPSYCLWTTPAWLWDNDAGAGKDTGPLKTFEVRGWMTKFQIKKQFVTSIDGLSEID